MLDCICNKVVISISSLRMNEYSSRIIYTFNKLTQIEIIHLDIESISKLYMQKSVISKGELSSIEIAKRNQSIVVLSERDRLFLNHIKNSGVKYILFEHFFEKIINDEKLSNLYKILKVA